MTAVDHPPAPPASRRGAARRALHGLSSVLIVSGILLLLDAGLTVLWQEPLSAIYAKVQQDKLGGQLEELQRRQPSPIEERALANLPDDASRLAFSARALDRRVKPGHPLGRLRIPGIGLSKVIVQGTGTADLKKGPGHYPATPLPGAPGTVGIAGHRTTYGAPFRTIDKLKPGDRLTMEMPYGTFTYSVERTQIVLPSQTEVVRRVKHDRLVLTACHPLYSAAKRIVVFAKLTRSRAS